MSQFLNCRGKLLDISSPVVMGILNISPDSFYDGGKFNDETDRKTYVEQMLINGAAIIDIGAVSSRPGAADVSEHEEWERLSPVLKELRSCFPGMIISVDTFRSEIARKALEEGASIINDITSGADAAMMETVARYNAPYIIMHMQGIPATMQHNPTYENVAKEVLQYLAEKVHESRLKGITDIIVDPGFGFGKTVEHNFKLLKELQLFKILNCPLLAGLSRKSMINKTLRTKPEQALNGTTSLNTIALMKGASILRVHDIKEAKEVVKLYNAFQNA